MNSNDLFLPSNFFTQLSIGCLVCLLSCGHSLAAPFTNLTFDAPNVAGLTPTTEPPLEGLLWGRASEVLPGWSLMQGDAVDPIMYFADREFRNVLPATLFRSIFDPRLGSAGYALNLNTGDRFGNDHDTWISQIGEIPAEADRLALFVDHIVGFYVSLDGIRLDLTPNPDALRFYEVDVSPWKGRTVELRLGIDDSPFTGGATLDILGFKTLIPEPGAGALLLAGAGCRLWLARLRSVRR